MELQPYLSRIAADLDRVTALADDRTREVSQRLAVALEPGLRLAMTELLADAAAELSARPGGNLVTVRMDGQEPVLQVTHTRPDDPVDPPDRTSDAGDGDDTARVTVRLPDGLKRRAEALAGQAQQSLNTWIVQAVRRATDAEPARRTSTSHNGRRLTGWA